MSGAAGHAKGAFGHEDRRRFLAEWWMTGFSTKEIAKEASRRFNDVITKNMVIGTARRMGLQGRPSPICRVGNPSAYPRPKKAVERATPKRPYVMGQAGSITPLPSSQPRREQPPARQVHPPVVLFIVPPIEPAPVLEFRIPHRRWDGSGCRFITTNDRPYLFCDADLEDTTKPYCRACSRKAYVGGG
jgi:hypothetical protein